ncbi:RNA helicase ERCC4-like protein [Nitzschia inconspicua]|uniref:RNA helicase ERCC4-like protein n=1 Tax=Nitzschia inconspicua TaxID=303405 RepID=A0A9K3PDX4_9STRA|nr:RNA helicase ERCC4-like protein [Nitzschia inconspicua]
MELNDRFEDADEEEYLLKIAPGNGRLGRSEKRRGRLRGLVEETKPKWDDRKHEITPMDIEADCIMDDGDNLEEDEILDNTTTAAKEVVFDEKKFFSAPKFPGRVLEQAKAMIYDRIEDALRRLEAENGNEVFLKYRQERRKKAKTDKDKQQQRLQRNLDDFLVRGDPRDYQIQLLNIALKTNTIVNLGTGTGKTMIALMCIKEIRATDQEHKQTLFLVPSVALAIQHSLTLQANLPNYKIESAYCEKSGSQNSKKRLMNCDIIVATHGAIMDLLMHYGDMFSLNRFNLVVIDECHYACGSHPYRLLMNKFYHTLPPKDRPHILGLTASPLISFSENYSDEQLSGLLDNLEGTLDATLVSASGLQESFSEPPMLSLQSKTIEEEVLHYQSTNRGRSIPSAKNLLLLPSRYREFEQLEYLYKEVGPLVLRIYSQVVRRELSRNFFESESNEQFARAREYLKSVEDFCDQEVQTLPAMGRTDKLLALEELVENLIENNEDERATGLVFVERRIMAVALHCYFSHKRDVLLKEDGWKIAVDARRDLRNTEKERLESLPYEHSSDFEDSTDDPLHVHCRGNGKKRKIELLNPQVTLEGLHVVERGTGQNPKSKKRSSRLDSSRVYSVVLVRNPTHIFNSLSLAHHKLKDTEMTKVQDTWVHKDTNLRETLAAVRSGDVNLLFATAVVEEGLDVKACSFVVAFDGINSVKGYIQMKGRARHENAKFFLLHDPLASERKQLDLPTAREMERRVGYIIEKRMRAGDEDVVLSCPEPSPLINGNSEPNELSAIQSGLYKVGEAAVDLHTAKSLLHRYYVSLPMEDMVRQKKALLTAYLPSFDNDKLELPTHIPHSARTVLLPDEYKGRSKKEKEKILSLMAVVRLHRHGLLNERLLPLNKKDMHRRILNLLSAEIQRSVHVPKQRQVVNSDESVREFYVYPMRQHGTLLSLFEGQLKGQGHMLGLLTLDPIHTFEATTVHHKEFGHVTLSLGEPTVVVCSPDQCQIFKEIFSLLFNHRWSRRSRDLFYEFRDRNDAEHLIQPYFVAILSRTLSLDFEMMARIIDETKRTFQQRQEAVAQTVLASTMPSPRIWSPVYSEFRQYVVSGSSEKTCNHPFPRTDEGIDCFRDYYKSKYGLLVQEDEPLFEARCFWTCNTSLRVSPIQESDSSHDALALRSILLPPSLCVEAPLADPHIALLSLFLPQFLFLFERNRIVEGFLRHCELEAPILGSYCRRVDAELLATVLTAKSCNREDNYDTWEWLGDAVLKLLQSDSLLKSQKPKGFVEFLHEGDLSLLRSAMGSNERLAKVCTRFGIEKFVMAAPLARGKWIPSPLRVRKDNDATRELSETRHKTMADIVEALLGLIYIKFGYDACREVGQELEISLEFSDLDSTAVGVDHKNRDLENVVYSCTDYKHFQSPQLLEEAFTHPSAINTTVPSYQRLEWIGDAVICLCAREWLFRKCSDDLKLKDLVMMEDAVVSNETLALLSMKHGLPHYLNHRDQMLPGRLESYFSRVQGGSGLWNTDPPKTVSDLVESLMGAIHIDGGYEAGQAAAKKILAPIFEIVISTAMESKSTLVNTLMHPKRALQEVTGELLDLTSTNEVACASNASDSIRVLYHERWDHPNHHGASNISTLTFLNNPIIGVADESLSISRNRACLLIVQALNEHPKLKERVAQCQSRIASLTTSPFQADASTEED